MKTSNLLIIALVLIFFVNVVSAGSVGVEARVTGLTILGNQNPMNPPNISINPSVIDFGTIEGTNQIVYLETEFVVKNMASELDGTILSMFISGTDFYDSSSSGARCPVANQFELSRLKYFATNGEYSTLDDPRADSEGYAPIGYGLPWDHTGVYDIRPIFEDQNGNILRPQGEIKLKFKATIPKICKGDFDSGSIFVIGKNIENPDEETYVSLPLKIPISPEVDIKMISDVTILDKNGNPRDSRITSLREGEKMLFDVQVNTGSPWANVYTTIGDVMGAGNDIVSPCTLYQQISDGISNYHCSITVDSPEFMYGEYATQAEVEISSLAYYGTFDYVYSGEYFFNMDFSLPENITVYENQKVIITPITEIPDATYSIDDPRFTWNGTSFIWQTNETDGGDYTFTITAEHSEYYASHDVTITYFDQKQINVHVIDNCRSYSRLRGGSNYLCYYPIGDNEIIRISPTKIKNISPLRIRL